MNKNRIILFAFLGVFALPFVLAYLMIWRGVNLEDTTNYGTFLQESYSLTKLGLQEDVSERVKHDKWRVWMLRKTPKCDSACFSSIEQTINAKRALGKNHDRIELMFSIPDISSNKILQEKLVAFKLLPKSEQVDALLQEGLYIVDPFGSLVLQYPLTGEHIGLLKDLKKLLRYSKF